jgi:hypothetical protein
MLAHCFHQITTHVIGIKLDTFSCYIVFFHKIMGIILGVDIAKYILLLLEIPHFNGSSI